MKLYYSPGACSMSVHIALVEAGLDFEAAKVDLKTHKLANGDDYYAISPRGYVPLLELDDGSRHTEAAALLQYVGDLDPNHELIPAPGTPERQAVVEWLTFVSTELHKTFSPWLFQADINEDAKQVARDKLAKRFADLDATLASRDYLAGRFSVADAYCFTIVNWSRFVSYDLAPYSHLRAYLDRVAARPKVREVLMREGLVK